VAKDEEPVRLLKTLSFLCVLATVGLAILWYFNPDGNYEPITVALGGVSAALIIVSQILQRRQSSRTRTKPLSAMSRDEILELVMESEPSQDWEVVYSERDATAIFKRDPNLRIEHTHDFASLHSGDFREKWANRFLDPHARSYYYDLYYGATRIARFILVHVDGGRACLPLPRSPIDLGVERIRYKVALIFDQWGTCESYMARAGLHLTDTEKSAHA
jgi:hypothetical protein